MIVDLYPTDTAFTIWTKPHMGRVGVWVGGNEYVLNVICLTKSMNDDNLSCWWFTNNWQGALTIVDPNRRRYIIK